jgi:hypothetical protein
MMSRARSAAAAGCALLAWNAASFAATSSAIRVGADAFPLVITNAGSYRLTNDVHVTNPASHGITVLASDVVIDLHRHILGGPGDGAGSGIFQPAGFENLTVTNGNIVSWRRGENAGEDDGCALLLRGSRNRAAELYCISNTIGARIASRSVVSNSNFQGQETGIRSGPNCLIYFCTVFETRGDAYVLGTGTVAAFCTSYDAGIGFRASEPGQIDVCTAYSSTGAGILATARTLIRGSAAYSNEIGIFAADHVTILDSAFDHNRAEGVLALSNGAIINSVSTFNGGDGFGIGWDCEIRGCAGNVNSGAGYRVVGSGNLIDSNAAGENAYGFVIEGDDNTIVGNRAGDNPSGDFAIEGSNTVGAMLTGDAVFTNSDPDANRVFQKRAGAPSPSERPPNSELP